LLLFYAGAVSDPQESSPAEAGFLWPKPGFFRPLAWLGWQHDVTIAMEFTDGSG